MQSSMYANIGLKSYEIWVNPKDEKQNCSKCKKILNFRDTHMHEVAATKAIKKYRKHKGEFKGLD